MEELYKDSFAYYVNRKVKNLFEKIAVDKDDYYFHPTYSISR